MAGMWSPACREAVEGFQARVPVSTNLVASVLVCAVIFWLLTSVQLANAIYDAKYTKPAPEELVRRARSAANALIGRGQQLSSPESDRHEILRWWEDVQHYLAYTSQPLGTGERWRAILDSVNEGDWHGAPLWDRDLPTDDEKCSRLSLERLLRELREFRDELEPSQLNLDRFWDEREWSRE